MTAKSYMNILAGFTIIGGSVFMIEPRTIYGIPLFIIIILGGMGSVLTAARKEAREKEKNYWANFYDNMHAINREKLQRWEEELNERQEEIERHELLNENISK